MLCSRCQKKEALVHYTAVVNGQETSAHLCQPCARSAGIAFPSAEAVSFPSVPPALSELFGLLSAWPARPAAAAIARTCPRCKWTIERFQKTGRMGCPDCYAHFRTQAKNVLSRLHGTFAHKGRRPGAAVSEKPRGREKVPTAPELRSRLEAAIRHEKFEEAAVLRDMLRRIEVGE